jgi:excisionase family DNA binding protein
MSTMTRPPVVLPNAEDRRTAQDAGRIIASLHGALRMRAALISSPAAEQTFILPAPVVRLLAEVLAYVGDGAPVTVIPQQAELTTQQAAGYLNVSRPWVIKLIEKGELPHRMVGTHRRVRFADLCAYKDRLGVKRRDAVDALIDEAKAMGAYDK